jgi:inward rectifier potassium channel
VHARHAWTSRDILWDHRFVDVLVPGGGDRRVIDYRRFHDVEPDPAARR